MSTVSMRFQSETMDNLRRYRDNLQVQVNRDPARFRPIFGDGRLSMDDALMYLLLQQKQHGQRARKVSTSGTRDKDAFVEGEQESGLPLREPGQFRPMIPGEEH